MLTFRATFLKSLFVNTRHFGNKLTPTHVRTEASYSGKVPDAKLVQRQDLFRTKLPDDKQELEDFLNSQVDLRDLNAALHFIANEQGPKALFGPIEGRLLSLLVPEDDDLVSNYLRQNQKKSYEALCDTFVCLAENQRRPTPLLRALTRELCKTSINEGDFTRSLAKTIIITLNALVTLSFPNPVLISKLLGDFEKIVNFDELNLNSLNTLLRSLASLNWRPADILTQIYDHIALNSRDLEKYDQNVIYNLLYLFAVTNFKPEDLPQFYRDCVSQSREHLLDQSSRRWLSYVWSLAVLDLAGKHHFESVFQHQKCSPIGADSFAPRYSDVMKLLNLSALARLEHNFSIDFPHESIDYRLKRSSANQKFADKINQALSGLMETSVNNLKCEYLTPFGFILDCEILVDSNLELHILGCEKSLEDMIVSDLRGIQLSEPNLTRCALIYTHYEDMIANSREEVVGHKRIISRILKHYGYTTVFLPETLLTREKTSASFSNQIKQIITTTVKRNKSLD